jgi:hypothetical protein
VNMVRNAGNFLSDCTIGSFSRRALLHEWVSEWVSEWVRWTLCFPLHALTFCFRVVLRTPRFITGNDPVRHLSIV